MGLNVNIPAQGNNLFKVKKSKAILVHRNSYAYLEDDKIGVFRKNKPILMYNSNNLRENNKLFLKKALFNIYQSYNIYQNKLHRVKNEQ